MFLDSFFHDREFFFADCVTVIVSICVHELCHGIVAIWCGDRTPIETGHMTVNPVVHMGLMSLVLLLMAGIAWGAMPVDPRRMRGRYAPALVALAGPLSNVVMATLALTVYGLLPPKDPADPPPLQFLLWIFGWVNIALAIFNILPVPPLDGSRVLANLIPEFSQLLVALRAGGGIMIIFILVFMFAGNLIFPAAVSAARWYVHFIEGRGGL